MISVGAILGGPESNASAIKNHITRLMKAAVQACGSYNFGASPSVNVVFHVPGSLFRPEFEGVRDAKFSRKKKLLMVQVALPEHILESEDIDAYLIDRLHAANAVAFHFFKERGIDYSLREAEELVKRIQCLIS